MKQKVGGLLTTRLDRMSTCGGTICYYWTNSFSFLSAFSLQDGHQRLAKLYIK